MRRSLNDYQDCDWCGAMTRGRISTDDNVLRCGACAYPLSEGSFRVQTPRQVVKVESHDTVNTPHRAVQSMWDEHQSEWIRLAGEWSGPAHLRA